MSWQSVGQHTFVPTDKAVQVGSFDLAAGQDTIWVKITQLNNPGDWPWSYGILSWRNANGTPLGSVKAYSNRLGEVFRLGVGLPPSDGTGSLWFEPRGYNLGWLKAGFPWELKFEAQSGTSGGGSMISYWNRDPVNNFLSPATAGDDVDLGSGGLSGNFVFASDSITSRGTLRCGAADDNVALIGSTGIVSSYRDSASGKACFQSYVSSSPGTPTAEWMSDGTFTVNGPTSKQPLITLSSSGQGLFSSDIGASNLVLRESDPTLWRSETYVGPELSLVEELVRLEGLVKHLYETLRLAPPAGWEVWDGNTDLVKSRGRKKGHI